MGLSFPRARWRSAPWVFVAAAAFVGAVGCKKGPALSKGDPEDSLGGARPDGPKLGALLDHTPVFRRPTKKSPELGFLHAGAIVSRSDKAREAEDCTDGWYEVAPRGFVCSEKAATLNLEHPTLKAMALRPKLNAPLPYVYARTTRVTGLFERAQERGVELEGRLGKSTVLAVVGSWTAPDESNEPQRLGLLLSGQFVRADDLEAARGSDFQGSPLGEEQTLPLGFVVRRGVHTWDIEGDAPKIQGDLEYHAELRLTGRFRTVEEEKYWALDKGAWVRHKDVTVVLDRHEFPDFAEGTQRWLDVSIITGTAVLYEGRKPIYVTLVSVGRDRLGDPKSSASTAQGTFKILEKHITRRLADAPEEALKDAPWALRLESGQWIVASPRHDRFGIEHSDGDIEMAPKDGAYLFSWVTPELPEGWHGVTLEDGATATLVHVRK